ncbi:hypothetical protein [Paenibacillus sp. FSL R5-0519]|uniref:hypothetical protein n=1 Tax=Paenibacillus TaxID=44249 RepID=UPI0030D9EE2F
MKKYLIILIMLFSNMFLLSNVYGAPGSNEVIPSEVKDVAIKSMEFFKTKVSSSPEEYGWLDEKEVQHAELGEGYRLYYLEPNKINDADSILSISYPSDQWQFTVYSNGTPKSFLTVGKENGVGEFKLIQFGGDASDFVTSIDNFARLASQKTVQSKEVDPIIVKVGNVRYLVADVDNVEYALPDVSSQEKMLFTNGVDNSTLVEAKDTLSFIKNVKLQSDQLEGMDKPTGGTNYSNYNSNEGNSFLLNFLIIFTSLLIVSLIAYMYVMKIRSKKKI